ncbi:myeloid-associated differentiation marker-like [Amblyraja radiata]|uniref:myeloid-associated differentiation marker-like n=1 Tax=Amblyraja radiata TaxID=386614 RepID=UPI001401E2A9|nr:myeloid-associated differentiation marker-like [Amblyraja radiata]
MPVRFSDPSELISPKAVARLLQILFTCSALGLSQTAGGNPGTDAGFTAFAITTWCISFTSTLVVFVIEFTQLHSLFPPTWKNLSVALAAFCGLMNLTTSLTYPLLAVGAGQAAPCLRHTDWSRRPCSYHAAATACCCLAVVAYAAEVCVSRRGRPASYMATGPGLLKVVQLNVACGLSVPMATGAFPASPALWGGAAAALGACALLSLVAVVTALECRACCPVPRERLLAAASALGALTYGAALVVWTFRLSRQAATASGVTDCGWKVCLMSTVLLSINLLAYATDLVFSIKLSCSRN